MTLPTRHDRHLIDGEPCHQIDDVATLAPFLMTLTSASDVWAYISSNGGVTAGRRDADHAIFPYVTEDLVRDSAHTTGGVTQVRVLSGAHVGSHWNPFGPDHPELPPARRALLKSDLGDIIHFVEERPDLGLAVRVTWRVSPRFGLVRSVEVSTTGSHEVVLDVVDGLRNFLPPGVTARTQRELAPLLDAYKVCELDDSGLAWVRLNARLTDRAEASEALAVTTVWQVGRTDPSYCLSVDGLSSWPTAPASTQVRGERAAYLVRSEVRVAPGTPARWSTVVDVDQDAADVVSLRAEHRDPRALAAALEADIAAARLRLRGLVGSADGWTHSGAPMADAHHAASTMFNIMRGGVPAHGYQVERQDVGRFLSERNLPLAQRSAALLAGLPERMDVHTLREAVAATADPDLSRLIGEYVPLTFSRRHGDPSRPWNAFDIVLADETGAPRLAHQGNWRDIFQNWEALAWSFPAFTASFVRIFLNATTIDGYNPYRISRSGVDWEVPEPENPWANIGYWSDHQIGYLARLLELLREQDPEQLRALGADTAYVHVDVPYRLASYADLVRDPHNTVTFEEERHDQAMARVAEIGGDGRLLRDADGALVRAGLGEKLLILLTAKLVNFVPDGGIWMNTQRPEWNDANNALVGRGLSVVTVAYLHRYVELVQELLRGQSVEMSVPLARAVEAITAILDGPGVAAQSRDAALPLDSGGRRELLDALGEVGGSYRDAVRSQPTERVQLDGAALAAHLEVVARWLARTVRRNRRPDGLYHAYNLLTLETGMASIEHLDEMLEGQVAVLSSGVLEPAEVDALLAALPGSALYRPDVRSYQLYPEPSIPTFLERNRVPTARWQANALLVALIEQGDRRLVVRDIDGGVHFAAPLRNAQDVSDALATLAADGRGELVAQWGADVLAVFEEVFRHASYTGRSSSFFAYEGVGSVYWHMVSKLLVAVREHLDAALRATPRDAGRVAALRAAYDQVRSGLGFAKSAQEYGAFPHDPYSHTPAGKGARQPGMTGQVKEDVLARWAELGVSYRDGRIAIDASAIAPENWSSAPGVWRMVDLQGHDVALALPADTIGLTVAQTPIVLARGEGAGQVIEARDSAGNLIESARDGALSVPTSSAMMLRTGRVARVDVRW